MKTPLELARERVEHTRTVIEPAFREWYGDGLDLSAVAGDPENLRTTVEDFAFLAFASGYDLAFTREMVSETVRECARTIARETVSRAIARGDLKGGERGE